MVGQVVQLQIGQPFVRRTGSDRVGNMLRLFLEEFHNRGMPRIIRICWLAGPQNVRAFCLTHQIEGTDSGTGLAHHGTDELVQMSSHPLDSIRVEQISGVLDGEADGTICTGSEEEGEIELACARLEIDGLDHQFRQGITDVSCIAEGDDNVKEGVSPHVATQIEFLDEHVEGVGAVVESGFDGRADPLDDRRGCILTGDLVSQSQHVHEKANLALQIGMLSSGNRRAYDNVA